jgi:hypothetical protein
MALPVVWPVMGVDCSGKERKVVMGTLHFFRNAGRAGLGFLAVGGVMIGANWAVPAHHPRTLHVVEHALTDTTVDIGPKGDSRGDILAFANPVFDAANRRRIGSDNGQCIRTVAGQAYECAWTTFLPEGQITVAGPFFDTRDSNMAITGGTGQYRTAHGEMRLHARNAQGTAYDFIFHIEQ